MGPRKLIKQGVLAKAKSGRKLKVFLCSDILVLTDQNGRNLYRMVCISPPYTLLSRSDLRHQPIPLAHAEVKEIVSALRGDIYPLRVG